MENLSGATREVLWNISHLWLMYGMFALALVFLGYGLYQRISYWKQGKPDDERFSDWGKRLGILLKELLTQRAVRESRFPGVFHSLIFYSFLVLFITTAVIALDEDAGTNLFNGYLYSLLSFAADIGGLLILIGILMAAYRRYVLKPTTLESTFDDAFSLVMIGLIVLTGFLIEGLRIAVAGDQWPWLSPVGWATSGAFAGISESAGRNAHLWLWWGHTVLAMVWVGSIPYTKFFHFLALPTNIFFSKLNSRGELKHEDIEAMMESENAEDLKIGLGKAGDFTWKQRLDFDACISCGRCEEICPAVMANQPFSPRKMIANLKNLVHARSNGNGTGPVTAEETETPPDAIVGNAFDENFIWYCRTCTACMEVCPALIEHADMFIEMRRNEVLMQGRLPADAQRALKMLETQGNPFGSQEHRSEWVKELGLRVIEAGEECDVIYWIGCCTTFDPTKQTIAASLCRLMQKSGIEFGVLGTDETCCGDPARVLGQEHLFQQIARQQIEVIKSRKFRVLLVSCPHCYNVLKNEYSQLGGDFNVVHHSEFLHEVLWGGQLDPKTGVKGRYVYHDPCYLGRYQHIYQSPREVIKSIPGVELVEMKNNREKSLCCGGGGGHYWMDLHGGERINNLRVQQAIDANADHIVTGCAYCKQMIEDSVKILNKDEDIRVLDIATLVLESVDGHVRSAAEYKKDAPAEEPIYPVCGS